MSYCGNSIDSCISCSNAFCVRPILAVPNQLPRENHCDCTPSRAFQCEDLINAAIRKLKGQYQKEIDGLKKELADNNFQFFGVSDKYTNQMNEQYCALNKVLADYEEAMFRAMEEECEEYQPEGEVKCRCKCRLNY